MKWMKAKPQQGKMKVAMYGPSGSGKSFTALMMAEGLAKRDGKRIAYVDTERGTDFYALDVKDRPVHPKSFDFDAIYTKSLNAVLRAVEQIDLRTHSVVVIDSISHLWDAAIEAYEGRMTSQDTIPMHAWGKIKKPYKKLISTLMGMDAHVFILGRQKNVFADDEKGKLVKLGVTMRSEGETPYEPNILIRLECQGRPGERAKHVGFVEKDRSGVLAGRILDWPNFDTIIPVLELLNGTQAKPEDDEERIAADGELLAEQENTGKKKLDKSKALFDEMVPTIRAAGSTDDLASVAKSIKKHTRHLTEEHHASLKAIYLSRRQDLDQTKAPVTI